MSARVRRGAQAKSPFTRDAMDAMRVAASRLAGCGEPHATALSGMTDGCGRCGLAVVSLVGGAAITLHAAGTLIVEPQGDAYAFSVERDGTLRVALPRVRARGFVDNPLGMGAMSLAGSLIPSLLMRSTGMRGSGTATKRAKKGCGA